MWTYHIYISLNIAGIDLMRYFWKELTSIWYAVNVFNVLMYFYCKNNLKFIYSWKILVNLFEKFHSFRWRFYYYLSCISCYEKLLSIEVNWTDFPSRNSINIQIEPELWNDLFCVIITFERINFFFLFASIGLLTFRIVD